MWVPVLEKAWAKAVGNYDFITSAGADYIHNPIRFFTGLPILEY